MTRKQKKELKRIIIALIIFFGLLIFQHSPLLPEITGNRLIMLVFYLVPYFIVGWDVVRKAGLGIKNRSAFDESFLMTIATVGAFATGENPEAVAVMLFYQIGEFFQQYAVHRSRRSIKDLMDIAPESANRLEENGSIEVIDPDEVEIGDILVVKPGERVPVDAVITEGNSMLNTSALTGESVPRSAKAGDDIFSGCINGEGLLKIKAVKKYEDSTVSKILEMVENASSRKSRTENFITRFARVYTPLVVLAAAVVAFIPPIFAGNWIQWIYRACTFLVVSCPCAVVISVPLAFFGGIGAASASGVLVKGSNYLELLGSLHTLVSDKTGTLTKGEFRVNRVQCAEGVEMAAILELAATAESTSTHPIAKSIQSAYGRKLDPAKVASSENVSGEGVIAGIGGHQVLVGNAKLMHSHNIDFPETDDPASTIVYVAQDGSYMGTILISDTIRPEAREAIDSIRAAGVSSIVMLTGDRKGTADEVGKQLGVDAVYSELLPGDKVDKVEELLKEVPEKSYLAFIGDGINDAPVLSRADVGIAMGSMGSDAAIEAADVVIMDDNLKHIPKVIRIARKTIRLSRQNITFSLVVKIAILVLAAIGMANMWAAVFGDVGVAVICILNSMRLLIRRKETQKDSDQEPTISGGVPVEEP